MMTDNVFSFVANALTLIFVFKLQTKRLSHVEDVAKDTTFEVDDLRYKTKV